MHVTSGYRCEALNEVLGGSSTSDHCLGKAADIVLAKNRRKEAFHYIREHLPYDQLLWEFGDETAPDWIHVSYRSEVENRKQVLIASKQGKKTQYTHYVA